jgi:uncharacterized membrane protein
MVTFGFFQFGSAVEKADWNLPMNFFEKYSMYFVFAGLIMFICISVYSFVKKNDRTMK